MEFLERFWHGCGGHCHSEGGSCPLAEQFEQEPDRRVPFDRGPALVASSAGVFLMPLLLAIGGAYAAGEYLASESSASVGLWQTGGMLVGLAAGIIVARTLLRVAQRRMQPTAQSDEGSQS